MTDLVNTAEATVDTAMAPFGRTDVPGYGPLTSHPDWVQARKALSRALEDRDAAIADSLRLRAEREGLMMEPVEEALRDAGLTRITEEADNATVRAAIELLAEARRSVNSTVDEALAEARKLLGM
jgi:hypothetical protein